MKFVEEILLENNVHEETITGRRARELARLTLYRMPPEWYLATDGDFAMDGLRFLLFAVWVDMIDRLRGYQSNALENELRDALREKFLTGETRAAAAEETAAGAWCWECRREVIQELVFRNYAADVLEAGYGYCLDAWQAGAPLEHIFPEYF